MSSVVVNEVLLGRIIYRLIDDTAKTMFTRCRYDLKTEQNLYGKASCSHDAGMKII